MIHVGDIMSIVGSVVWEYSNNKRFFLHSTEHPHGTHKIPHMHHDIPHGTEYPHGTHDIPHGTEHPHGTQNIPHMHHDIPHGTERPPRYCTHVMQDEGGVAGSATSAFFMLISDASLKQ